MLYQKLLMGNHPYYVSVENASAFEMHRHPEIELSYCMEGMYDVVCKKKQYSIKAGDFVVVAPMTVHEFPECKDVGRRMTINLGYTLLGEYFETFTTWNSDCHLYKKSDLQHTELYRQLVVLLEETAALHASDSALSELSVKGNLYKISALLLQMLHSPQTNDTQNRKLNDIKKIEKALDKIYTRYYEPLSIEEVSASCGYSKSNFCKVFKHITGETFHNMLNRHRIEIACDLLQADSCSVETVAGQTGFPDTKSFCRVFKKLMGKSAGEYRRSIQSKETRQ